MYAQVEKLKENKSRAVTNSIVQKKSNGKKNAIEEKSNLNHNNSRNQSLSLLKSPNWSRSKADFLSGKKTLQRFPNNGSKEIEGERISHDKMDCIQLMFDTWPEATKITTMENVDHVFKMVKDEENKSVIKVDEGNLHEISAAELGNILGIRTAETKLMNVEEVFQGILSSGASGRHSLLQQLQAKIKKDGKNSNVVVMEMIEGAAFPESREQFLNMNTKAKDKLNIDLGKLFWFDLITHNTDRHGGNLMLTQNGDIVGIDQTLAFSLKYEDKTLNDAEHESIYGILNSSEQISDFIRKRVQKLSLNNTTDVELNYPDIFNMPLIKKSFSSRALKFRNNGETQQIKTRYGNKYNALDHI